MGRLIFDYHNFRRLADQPRLLAFRNAIASALGWKIKTQ
jgi:hypothetical protein